MGKENEQCITVISCVHSEILAKALGSVIPLLKDEVENVQRTYVLKHVVFEIHGTVTWGNIL